MACDQLSYMWHEGCKRLGTVARKDLPMKLRALPVALAFTSLFAFAGCDAEESGDPGAQSSDVEESGASGLSAELTFEEVDRTEQNCKVYAKYLTVDLDDEAAADRINAALDRADPLGLIAEANGEAVDCAAAPEPGLGDFVFDTQATMTVSANSQGVLSVTESGTSFSVGAAHDNHYIATFNFDLATGKPLALSDVMEDDTEGLLASLCGAAYFAQVKAESEASGEEPWIDEESLVGSCRQEIDGEFSPARFAIEDGGLRIHASFGHAGFVLEAEGALVAWADLDGFVTATGVQKIASRAGDAEIE